jgi:hypothetical protein
MHVRCGYRRNVMTKIERIECLLTLRKWLTDQQLRSSANLAPFYREEIVSVNAAIETLLNAESECSSDAEGWKQSSANWRERAADWKKQALALVVLLRAKCGDREWADLGERFSTIRSSDLT